MKKILLIDNDVELLNSIANLLTHNNYEVDKTYDAILGISKLLTNSYDLLITNLHLKKIPTKELIQAMYSHKVTIPVILITSKETLNNKLLNFEVVANEYLTLPFSSKELLTKISKTLEMNENNHEKEFENVKLGNFLISSNSAKRYLTTTEITILDKLLKDKDVSINELYGFVYAKEDLQTYIEP